MIELSLHTIPIDLVDGLSDLLESQGALAVTLVDANNSPVLEPLPGETPLWPEVTIEALFEDATSCLLTERVITSLYPSVTVSKKVIADQNWVLATTNQSKPMCFGSHFFVYPSHVAQDNQKHPSMILDPGLAFGTGSHPTTALCLTWLAKNVSQIENKTIIDYGCGSGILLIAALKLGAEFAYGVDIDPQAIEATRVNLDKNHVDMNFFELTYPEQLRLEKPVDLIMANILLTPLLTLKETFEAYLKPRGILVVSGILEDQTDNMKKHYETHFDLVEQAHQTDTDTWSLLVFQKK